MAGMQITQEQLSANVARAFIIFVHAKPQRKEIKKISHGVRVPSNIL
jgi:hypothetical protein